MTIDIIIPLCGKGSRFYPNIKSLVKVFTKPILQHVIDSLPTRPTIIVNDRTYHKDFELYGDLVNIHEETQGAAETIYKGLLAMKKTTGSILFLDGDTFYREDIVSLINKNPLQNQVITFKDTQPTPFYSYVKTDDDNKILAIREKEKISDLANTGAYYFANIHELLESCKEVLENKLFFKSEPYISSVIHHMLQKQIEFYSTEISSDLYFSLGTPQQVASYINSSYLYLFDLDGTLVQTDKFYYKAWEQILKTYQIVLTESIYKEYIYSNSDSNVKKTLLKSFHITLEELSQKKDEYFLQYANDLIPTLPGAISFIKSVYNKGFPIAIVTNCNRKVAEFVIEKIGIKKYISQIIVGDECERSKPYSDPYEKALQIFNIPSNRCFIFEDSPNGILSAKGVSPKCLVGISSTAIGADVLYEDYTSITHEALVSFTPTTEKINHYKAWIQKSLEKRFSSIDSIEISPLTLKGGFIADVYSVSFHINQKEHKVIFKVENKNESTLNKIAHDLDLYNRENYFYESVSQHIPIKTPYFYGLVRDNSFNTIGILLENLNKDNFHLNLDLNKESIETSFSVIEALAKMHASCWGKNLDKQFLLKKNNHSSFQPGWKNFIQGRSEDFMKKWGSFMNDLQKDFFETTCQTFDEIQNVLSEEPLTCVHGDVKSPNIFFSKETTTIPYFIDWQYIVYGKGVQDLVFFMIESFTEETIQKYFKLFLEYYYIKLLEYNVKNYSYTQYINDFKAATKYFPFFVAIWFGTTKSEDLIDLNFPYFYIKRYLNFINLISKECQKI